MWNRIIGMTHRFDERISCFEYHFHECSGRESFRSDLAVHNQSIERLFSFKDKTQFEIKLKAWPELRGHTSRPRI